MVKTSEAERAWHLIDADGQPAGRLAVTVAQLLRGRTKPTWAPHLDGGDFVVVINAEKIKLTGNKETQKIYQDYTGYASGLKERPAHAVRKTHPEQILKRAVRGMLPHNRLSRHLFGRLKVYAGTEHPHAAQKPQPYAPAL